ncbi:MAG: hypothetical protein AAFN74_04555 [Myxococcota bacterium]
MGLVLPYLGRMKSHNVLNAISADDLEYYRQNPEEARELLNRETVRRKMIGWIVVLAAVLVAGSKLVAFYLSDLMGDFIVSVLVDLVFEMGAALMGAVATLVFVEVAQAQQYEENKRLYRALKEHLEADGSPRLQD